MNNVNKNILLLKQNNSNSKGQAFSHLATQAPSEWARTIRLDSPSIKYIDERYIASTVRYWRHCLSCTPPVVYCYRLLVRRCHAIRLESMGFTNMCAHDLQREKQSKIMNVAVRRLAGNLRRPFPPAVHAGGNCESTFSAIDLAGMLSTANEY